MTHIRVIHLGSLEALRATAVAWDDLWSRSEATLPSLRAEMLAQWVEQFAPSASFRTIAVEAGSRLVAALPLVGRKVGRLLPAGAMPGNEWSSSGEVLLDTGQTEAATNEVLDALVDGIRQLDWPLLWLDEALLGEARWQQFEQAAARAGMAVATHVRCHVGRVTIDHDWHGYKSRWSRKHRQKMAQAARQLSDRGKVRLMVHCQLAPADVAAVMRHCFDIEDLSWKGAAGTSILRTPGMAEFYLRQAHEAARWGELEVVLLYCGDRAVAFSYGLRAKGVFHSIKVGYDPQYATYHPGQLLRYYLLERLFADPNCSALDFQGPMTEAHAAWLPEPYPLGRLGIAAGGVMGRLAVRAYGDAWPLVAGWLGRRKTEHSSGNVARTVGVLHRCQ